MRKLRDVDALAAYRVGDLVIVLTDTHYGRSLLHTLTTMSQRALRRTMRQFTALIDPDRDDLFCTLTGEPGGVHVRRVADFEECADMPEYFLMGVKQEASA